jgi:hypothetical protein
MLLQHAVVDKLDLAPLYQLVQSRGGQVDGLAGLKQRQVVEVEQWVVEVAAQILETEQALLRDETRL